MTSSSIHGLRPALNVGLVVYYINAAYISDSFVGPETCYQKDLIPTFFPLLLGVFPASPAR